MKKYKNIIEAIVLYILGTILFLNSGINTETFYVFNFLGVLNFITATVQLAMFYFNFKK